jgi:hypothetical protein
MKMCRDIANRAKHETLRPKDYSREPYWSLAREYVAPWGREEGVRLILFFDDLKAKPEEIPEQRFEFLSVIRDCKAFWDDTLTGQNLI